MSWGFRPALPLADVSDLGGMSGGLCPPIVCVCVLCSIERLFDELTESAYLALDPLQVAKSGVVNVSDECQRDPKSLFSLIYVHR